MLMSIVWKHLVTRLNNIILTLCELILPIAIFILVIYSKSLLGNVDKVYINETTYNDNKSNKDILTNINIGNTYILYAPYTAYTYELIREVQLKLNLYNENIKSFKSEKDLINAYDNNYKIDSAIVIIFNDKSHFISKYLDYEIKIYEDGIIWNTDKLFTDIFKYIPMQGSDNYIDKGFAAIQVALDISYIEMITNKSFDLQLTHQEFPYPPHLNTDNITTSFRYILPFIIIFSFIFICPMTLKRIVMEKTSGLKELLKINGIKSSTLWICWFLNQIIINIISVICISIILLNIKFSSNYAIIEHCNCILLIIFLLLYCSSTITFFFTFSTFFDKAVLSMILGIILWISSYCIFMITVSNIEINNNIIINILLIFPPFALYYGFNIISMFEIRDIDISFSNIFESPYGNISLGFVIMMLFIDTIFYFLLAIFLDRLWPGKYGIPESVNPFKKIIIKKKNSNQILLQDLNYIIQLKNVSKIYNNNIKAIDDLTFDINKNKITSLLGENGAGKSTIMTMIMGLTTITSGSIHSIKRTKISYCPQHNLLYDELTVIQHLILFGMLSGLNMKESKKRGEELLQNTLSMFDKINSFPYELSGGMKRKLSLGISLMNDPEILILDEPTASIDVEGRREILDLILSFKNKKTILISTHLLEEADYLSDYIVIMNSGKLICYGTPLDLKSKYNIGYKCIINDISINNNILKNYVSDDDIKIIDNNIICNFNKSNKKNIPLLLKYLDNKNISYSFSSSTLEDLYLKVQSKEKNKNNINQIHNIKNTNQSLYTKINYYFNKRKLFFSRKIIQYLIILIISLIIFCVSLYLSDFGILDLTTDGRSIKLDLDLYGNTYIYYSIKDKDNIDIITNTQNILRKVDNVSESIIEIGINNIIDYIYKLIIAFEFDFENNSINIMYSNKAYHAHPISINIIMNTILKYYTNDTYLITITKTSLHSNKKQNEEISIGEYSNVTIWLTLLPIGPLLIISMVLLLPTIDYIKNIRTIEKLCNIKLYQYWLFNYICDIIYYIISITIILIIIYFIPIHYLDIFIMLKLEYLFIIYGIICIPQAYIFTYTNTIENVYAKFLIINIICAPIIASALMILDIEIIIMIILIISPHTSLCYYLAIMSIKINEIHNWDIMSFDNKQSICNQNINIKHSCCILDSKECKQFKTYIDNNFIYYSIASLFIYTFILLTINYINQYISKILLSRKFDKLNIKPISNTNYLSINNVSKAYWKWLFSINKVLSNISITINNKICLGLLGVNGAGKSTIFRMLINDINPTIGNIKIMGSIGYCPQQNSLIDEFTGRELLYLYGKLRGIQNINYVTNKLLEKFDLNKIADKFCGTYSGGNKRKLSMCISIIGIPDCILLDEPTNGVDPISRRELWNLIEEIKKKSVIILSSHTITDCEALCDKLCILNKGTIEENTSISELKQKYCTGYILNIKLNKNVDIKQYLYNIFGIKNINILSINNYILNIRITNHNWITIFEKIESLKNNIQNYIDDYWIAQVSLDEMLIELSNRHN